MRRMARARTWHGLAHDVIRYIYFKRNCHCCYTCCTSGADLRTLHSRRSTLDAGGSKRQTTIGAARVYNSTSVLRISISCDTCDDSTVASLWRRDYNCPRHASLIVSCLHGSRHGPRPVRFSKLSLSRNWSTHARAASRPADELGTRSSVRRCMLNASPIDKMTVESGGGGGVRMQHVLLPIIYPITTTRPDTSPLFNTDKGTGKLNLVTLVIRSASDFAAFLERLKHHAFMNIHWAAEIRGINTRDHD